MWMRGDHKAIGGCEERVNWEEWISVENGMFVEEEVEEKQKQWIKREVTVTYELIRRERNRGRGGKGGGEAAASSSSSSSFVIWLLQRWVLECPKNWSIQKYIMNWYLIFEPRENGGMNERP